MSIIPALSRLRQENWEFQANLGYRVRPCLENKTKQKQKQKPKKLNSKCKQIPGVEMRW
jgi:hypothetical protein